MTSRFNMLGGSMLATGLGYIGVTRSVYHIVCLGSTGNLGPFQGAAVMYATVHSSEVFL